MWPNYIKYIIGTSLPTQQPSPAVSNQSHSQLPGYSPVAPPTRTKPAMTPFAGTSLKRPKDYLQQKNVKSEQNQAPVSAF